MNQADVRRLALVLAKQAEIEGMKATNIYCEQNDLSPTFSLADFSDKANELENLAYANDDQLFG